MDAKNGPIRNTDNIDKAIINIIIALSTDVFPEIPTFDVKELVII
jgi:hypothetical protein